MNTDTEITPKELSDYFYNNCGKAVSDKIEAWFSVNGNTVAATMMLRALWDSLEVETTPETIAETKAGFENFCKRLESDGYRDEKICHNSEHKIARTSKRLDVSRVFMRAAAILAIPLLFLSVFQYVQMYRNNSVEWIEKTVAYGSIEEVELPDGTVVTLNSGSRIVYPERFTGRTRQVVFSGEGFFDVTSDARKPFIVKSADKQVKVLGTEFNFKAYTEDRTMEVSLLEGKVAFSDAGSRLTESAGNDVYLSPGQKIEYDKESGTIKKSTFDHQNYSSWRDGHFYFKNTSLEDIVRQLERSFDAEIVIATDSLKVIPYYMAFVNNESLDDILSIIDSDPNIKVLKKGNIIEIY